MLLVVLASGSVDAQEDIIARRLGFRSTAYWIVLVPPALQDEYKQVHAVERTTYDVHVDDGSARAAACDATCRTPSCGRRPASPSYTRAGR